MSQTSAGTRNLLLLDYKQEPALPLIVQPGSTNPFWTNSRGLGVLWANRRQREDASLRQGDKRVLTYLQGSTV